MGYFRRMTLATPAQRVDLEQRAYRSLLDGRKHWPRYTPEDAVFDARSLVAEIVDRLESDELTLREALAEIAQLGEVEL